MKISNRGVVAPFHAMEVMKAANERAAAGGDVLHMEVGQPATSAPRQVIEAAARALRSEQLGYTEALGNPELRAAIAGHYRARCGVAVAPERIIVTTGSSGAFLLAFLAVFDVGQRLAMAEPGYPAYRNIMTALGIAPVVLPVGPEHRFQPKPELLQGLNGPLHGLLLASPANPTGTMIDAATMAALVRECAERELWLIVDEIYHGITYRGPAQTVLALTDDALVVNSFSKYFSMTGWRLGWMVVPERLVRPIERLAQNLFISPPAISQAAAMAAFLSYDELDANVARYARNRAELLDGLAPAGFNLLAPADGAFYIYADVSRYTADSEDFCKRLLAETGIAATPGIDFDRAQGHRYVRFSFAGATADMIEAVRRLKAWRK